MPTWGDSIAHMEELREWIEEEEKKTGEKGSGGTISVGQWEVSIDPNRSLFSLPKY